MVRVDESLIASRTQERSLYPMPPWTRNKKGGYSSATEAQVKHGHYDGWLDSQS
jgi:hypothetical protein